MPVYYQHRDELVLCYNGRPLWVPQTDLPVDDFDRAIGDMCQGVDYDMRYDDHVLYLIMDRTLIGICIYQQYSDHSHISTFCAMRDHGKYAFTSIMTAAQNGNLFKRVITLLSVPYAVNFYKSLGFVVDDEGNEYYEGHERNGILHQDLQAALVRHRLNINVTVKVPWSVIGETYNLWSHEDVLVPMILVL